MSTPAIIRFDSNESSVAAALAAEQALFAYYGLTYTTHEVRLAEPNIRVRVLDVGTGPPVLFVPGGSGDAWQFVPLLAQIQGRRCIVVDRPGGGLSDGVDHRQINLRHFAVTTLLTILDELELWQVPIIANSMGGLWALWLALDAPVRVSRLIQLGCPALVLGTSAPLFMRLLSIPGINRLLLHSMQPKQVETALDGLRFQGSTQDAIAALPAVFGEAAYHFAHLPTYRDTWRTLMAAVVSVRGARRAYQLNANAMAQVRQPVQFIWGKNDPFGDLGVAREAARLVPHGRLHEMHAGHLPHIDNPPVCAEVIHPFLAQSVAETVTFGANASSHSYNCWRMEAQLRQE